MKMGQRKRGLYGNDDDEMGYLSQKEERTKRVGEDEFYSSHGTTHVSRFPSLINTHTNTTKISTPSRLLFHSCLSPILQASD